MLPWLSTVGASIVWPPNETVEIDTSTLAPLKFPILGAWYVTASLVLKPWPTMLKSPVDRVPSGVNVFDVVGVEPLVRRIVKGSSTITVNGPDPRLVVAVPIRAWIAPPSAL